MFNRQIFETIDWTLFFLTFLLCSMGAGILYSAVNAGASTSLQPLAVKQLIWFGCGLICIVLINIFNYKFLDKWGVGIF